MITNHYNQEIRKFIKWLYRKGYFIRGNMDEMKTEEKALELVTQFWGETH